MNTHSPSDTHFPFKERSAEQEMLTHLSSVCFPLCCRVPMFMYDGYVAMQATVLIHCISLSPAVCTQHRNQESWKSCTHIGRLWKPFQ